MLTQQQIRQDLSVGVGSSEAGAVLGLNPYRTPLDVYLEKTGQKDPFEGNRFTVWGQALEDVVAKAYTERTNRRVRRVNQVQRHAERPWQVAHLDRLVIGLPRLVEIKTASVWTAGLWGDEGTDQFPDSYKAQVEHQMVVTGVHEADVPVLIGGNDFRVYQYEHDPQFAELLIAIEAEFWERVQTGTPPPPISRSDIDALFAADDGTLVEASEEAAFNLEKIRALKDEEKQINEAVAALSVDVQRELGPAAVMVDANGRTLCTFKKAKDSKAFDKKRFETEHPDLYAEYLYDAPGSRRFLVK